MLIARTNPSHFDGAKESEKDSDVTLEPLAGNRVPHLSWVIKPGSLSPFWPTVCPGFGNPFSPTSGYRRSLFRKAGPPRRRFGPGMVVAPSRRRLLHTKHKGMPTFVPNSALCHL